MLLFAGATECGAWQLPIYLLLAVLTLVPLAHTFLRLTVLPVLA